MLEKIGKSMLFFFRNSLVSPSNNLFVCLVSIMPSRSVSFRCRGLEKWKGQSLLVLLLYNLLLRFFFFFFVGT